MKDDYNICITGRQLYQGVDQGEVVIRTTGTYRQRNGKNFIVYKEYDDDDPSAEYTAVLKVEPGVVTMIRQGSSTRMIMEEGKRHRCLYDVGFGCMTVGVFASEVSYDLGPQGGTVDVRYTLDIDSNLSSQNELSVSVTPQPASNISL